MSGSVNSDLWIRRAAIVLAIILALSLMPSLFHQTPTERSHERLTIRTHIDTVTGIAMVPMNAVHVTGHARNSGIGDSRIARLDTILQTDTNAVGMDTISITHDLASDSFALSVRMSAR